MAAAAASPAAQMPRPVHMAEVLWLTKPACKRRGAKQLSGADAHRIEEVVPLLVEHRQPLDLHHEGPLYLKKVSGGRQICANS